MSNPSVISEPLVAIGGASRFIRRAQVIALANRFSVMGVSRGARRNDVPS